MQLNESRLNGFVGHLFNNIKMSKWNPNRWLLKFSAIRNWIQVIITNLQLSNDKLYYKWRRVDYERMITTTIKNKLWMNAAYCHKQTETIVVIEVTFYH